MRTIIFLSVDFVDWLNKFMSLPAIRLVTSILSFVGLAGIIVAATVNMVLVIVALFFTLTVALIHDTAAEMSDGDIYMGN